jgi:hypothetical protein
MSGVFYVHDSETGKQESLGTRDRAEARTLLNAPNESVRQLQLNLHIAKAYLAGTDSGVSTRTWQNVPPTIQLRHHGLDASDLLDVCASMRAAASSAPGVSGNCIVLNVA